LLTIASAIYFSLLGKNGIRKIADANIKNAMDLAKRVNEIFDVPFMGSTFFSEFLFKTCDIQKLRNKVFKKGIEFGPLLSGDSGMICTTEIHDKEDHDKLIDALREEKENV
jgi:glycine dehydrogenase subunit 1